MNQLKRLREEHGLTQAALEDVTGIERSKIARMEGGTRRISGTESVLLAQALDATPEDVLGTSLVISRYRTGRAGAPEDVERTAAWFRHFVEDALFVDRTARSYGLE